MLGTRAKSVGPEDGETIWELSRRTGFGTAKVRRMLREYAKSGELRVVRSTVVSIAGTNSPTFRYSLVSGHGNSFKQ